MSRIEGLLKAYDEFVRQPWQRNLSGAERVWFAVYEPAQERRLLFRIPEFAAATGRAGHAWIQCDVAGLFSEWMAGHKYRDAYFEDPAAMGLALPTFGRYVAEHLRTTLTDPDIHDDTVTAVLGVGSLFGLVHTSDVLGQVLSDIRGRLLVFFPGRYENAQYRLFDARDGWNYLAVPITGRNGD